MAVQTLSRSAAVRTLRSGMGAWAAWTYGAWIALVLTFSSLVLCAILCMEALHAVSLYVVLRLCDVACVVGGLGGVALVFPRIHHSKKNSLFYTVVVLVLCFCIFWIAHIMAYELLQSGLLHLAPLPYAPGSALNSQAIAFQLQQVFYAPVQVVEHVTSAEWQAGAEAATSRFVLGVGFIWFTVLLFRLCGQLLRFVIPWKHTNRLVTLTRIALVLWPCVTVSFVGFPVFQTGQGRRFALEVWEYMPVLGEQSVFSCARLGYEVIQAIARLPLLLPPVPLNDRFSMWTAPAEECAWFVLLLLLVPLLWRAFKRLGVGCEWQTQNSANADCVLAGSIQGGAA